MRKSLVLLSCLALLTAVPAIAQTQVGETPSSTRHPNIPSESTGVSQDSAMSSTTSGTHKMKHRHMGSDSHTGSSGSSKSTSTGGQSGMDTAGPGNAGGMGE